MFTLRGAHTGLSKWGVHYATSPSNCQRIAYLRAKGLTAKIEDVSRYVFAVGFTNERLWSEENPTALRDVPVSYQVSECTTFSGHVDGILNGVPYELKSVVSTRTLKEVFCEGKCKQNNLLQLVGYMIALEKQEGVLEYCGFLYHSLTYNKVKYSLKPGRKQFKVSINDSGDVYVDGTFAEFNVTNVIENLQAIAESLEKGYLPARPTTTEGFDSPCAWCSLSSVCNDSLIDNEQAFLTSAEMVGFVREGGAAKECGFVNLTKTEIPDTKEEFQQDVSLTGGIYGNRDSI